MIWIVLSIIVIICLVCISAFFSSAEMAFVSINRAVVKDKLQEGDKHAIVLDRLLQKPDMVISAIVIGNNLVNIFASILTGTVATLLFGNIGIGIATVLMMFVIIIFGESTPKSFGFQNMNFALRISKVLAFITWLFHPFVFLVAKIADGLILMTGGKKHGRSRVTEKEILAMMRLGEEQGTIERDEREMVKGVFKFDETRAYEIYTKKENVVFIQENTSLKDLIQTSISSGFSRFPVFRADFDDIVGMVHVKDSLKIDDKAVSVKSIMRPMLKIDSNMKADDLLRLMKSKKTHLALLLTADGKTKGLVSMEDVIEEIFGEIVDEHDLEHFSYDRV